MIIARNSVGAARQYSVTIILALIFILGAVLLPQNALAATNEPYLLDAVVTAGKKDFQISIPSNGVVQLTFIKTAATNGESKCSLYLNPFYGDRSGSVLPIELSATNLVFGTNSPVTTADPVTLGRPIVVARNNQDFARREWPGHFPTVITVNFQRCSTPEEFHFRRGRLAEFSASGEDVVVAWLGGTIKKVTGSSFAVPHVSGLLASLAESDKPTSSQ